MKIFYRALSLLILVSLLNVTNYGQNQRDGQRRMDASQFQPIGTVSGTIFDGSNNQPIEYANIVIYKWKDSTVANGTVSNAQGKFTVEKLMYGRYFMKISYIGYATKRFDSLVVRPNNTNLTFSAVRLTPKNVNMNEVVIKSEREAINYNLDKKVYNVDKNLANSGGTAVDVVQNLPAVQVDADGGVSVRGNSNITVLVDGRPAQLAGFSGSDVLAQIPASQIESIELVTNPSARYDPEGTGGIINVILKKKSNLGYSANLMANAGTKGRYSSSINGNIRGDNFNFFSSYDGRFFNMYNGGSMVRNSFFGGSSAVLDQQSSGSNDMKNHSISLGGDYYIGEKEFFTLNGQFRFGSFGSSSINQNINLDQNNIKTSWFDRNSDGSRDNSSGNYTLSYKKTYENRTQELTADLMYSQSSMSSDFDITQKYYDVGVGPVIAPSLQKSLSDNGNKMLLFQANYVQPLNSWGRFEGGVRSMIRDLTMSNDYLSFNYGLNVWGPSNLLNNEYDYKEQIHALYGIYSNAIGSLSFQAGLRAEQAIIDGTVPASVDRFESKYFEIYPTAHLRYSFSDVDEVQLSYSRRIDRPQNRQLNPYEDRSDSLNIVKGNPNLKPQFFNSFELGYTKMFSKTILVSNLFYRLNNNLISTISTLAPNGVTYSTYENVSKGKSYGIELILTQPFGTWWRLSGTFSYYNNSVEDLGTLGGTRESNSWRTMLNSQMTISDGFVLQSMIFYNSPSIQLMMGGFGGFGGGGGGQRGGGGGGGDMGGGGMFFGGAATQSKMDALYWMDLMLRKDFMDGQLSVTLRISDLFDTRKFDTETTASNFSSISKRFMDSRTVNLGLTYRIDTRNKMMEQERQKRIEEGYDEL